MKRLMVIITDYYPNPASTTNCVEPLLQGLENNGWYLDIITRRQTKEALNKVQESSHRVVWRVDDFRFINSNYWKEQQQNSGSGHKHIFKKALAFISKSLIYFKFCLFRLEPSLGGWNTRDVIKLCLELVSKEKYNAILSISHPVITHRIAAVIKEKAPYNISWLLYEFDPFCYNKQLYPHRSFFKMLKMQKALFENCDTILVIPSLFKFYQTSELKEFCFKMIPLEYANMCELHIDNKNAVNLVNASSEYNLFFAGALPRYVRNPKYVLLLFKQLDPRKFHLTMVSGTNLKYQKNGFYSCRQTVTLYPRQNRDTAYLGMKNADVLVNIGNAVPFQTPGKIFEYMATGKPIIHFSKIENDPCITYLKYYPYVLVVNEYEGSIQEHINSLARFCDKFGHEQLEYSQVLSYTKHFCSEKVVQDFCEIMKNFSIG